MRRREALALLASVAITWPLVARAQQKAIPVIGYLGTGSATPGPNSPFIAAFCQGLSETGYVVGQNLAIQYRWAEGRSDQLHALASDLVHRGVSVIVTSGPAPARAARDATSTIPIVFFIGSDPVLEGLVASFARPGGNVTGISMLAGDLNTKRLELLAEVVPQTSVIAFLVNPHNPRTDTVIRELLEAARAKRLQLPILKVGGDDDFETAFASLAQLRAGALVVGSDAFFNSRRQQLVALAARHGVPAIYEWREFAAEGGLISYGSNQTSNGHQLGIYVGKVLNGAKPADLPVEQPTKFELVINLKTAKALGLTVPQSLLARADEVIE
jgi:putative ABC transport system substrate-binding protein